MSEKKSVSLSTMLGSGIEFEAKGNKYKVMPIVAAHIEQFIKDNVSVDANQLFYLTNDDSKKLLNKWLGGEKVVAVFLDKEISAFYCYDSDNEPMSLDKAIADGWDVVDFKRYFKTMCDISG